MVAGESYQLTAEFPRQNFCRLCVKPLFMQRPLSSGHKYPDPVFLDGLDIRQVVCDGQELLVQEKIGRNFPIYVVIATLLPIPSHSFVGFHRLSKRVIKPEPKGKSKHRQSGPMPKCRIVDPRKKTLRFAAI